MERTSNPSQDIKGKALHTDRPAVHAPQPSARGSLAHASSSGGTRSQRRRAANKARRKEAE